MTRIGGVVKKRGDNKVKVCFNCKHYDDCLNKSGWIDQVKDDDTCEDWESEVTEEEREAQRTDAAERETHRKNIEGEIEWKKSLNN